MTPVRLEPAAPRSRAKHSTTEPLRSLDDVVIGDSVVVDSLFAVAPIERGVFWILTFDVALSVYSNFTIIARQRDSCRSLYSN